MQSVFWHSSQTFLIPRLTGYTSSSVLFKMYKKISGMVTIVLCFCRCCFSKLLHSLLSSLLCHYRGMLAIKGLTRCWVIVGVDKITAAPVCLPIHYICTWDLPRQAHCHRMSGCISNIFLSTNTFWRIFSHL